MALNRPLLVLSDDTGDPVAIAELERYLQEAHDHEADEAGSVHRGLKALEMAFKLRFYIDARRTFCKWFRSNCLGCQTLVRLIL